MVDRFFTTILIIRTKKKNETGKGKISIVIKSLTLML